MSRTYETPSHKRPKITHGAPKKVKDLKIIQGEMIAGLIFNNNKVTIPGRPDREYEYKKQKEVHLVKRYKDYDDDFFGWEYEPFLSPDDDVELQNGTKFDFCTLDRPNLNCYTYEHDNNYRKWLFENNPINLFGSDENVPARADSVSTNSDSENFDSTASLSQSQFKSKKSKTKSKKSKTKSKSKKLKLKSKKSKKSKTKSKSKSKSKK